MLAVCVELNGRLSMNGLVLTKFATRLRTWQIKQVWEAISPPGAPDEVCKTTTEVFLGFCLSGLNTDVIMFRQNGSNQRWWMWHLLLYIVCLKNSIKEIESYIVNFNQVEHFGFSSFHTKRMTWKLFYLPINYSNRNVWHFQRWCTPGNHLVPF